jgi:hypothetical protein
MVLRLGFVVALCSSMAGAASPPPDGSASADAARANQLAVEQNALSLSASYVRRVGPRLLLGVGIGGGPSPLLGAVVTGAGHYQSRPNVLLYELGHVEIFARFDPGPLLHLDLGLRYGRFTHGLEDFTGGAFWAASFSPMVGWRWLKVGPRLSFGYWAESGNAYPAAVLSVDLLNVRFVHSW